MGTSVEFSATPSREGRGRARRARGCVDCDCDGIAVSSADDANRRFNVGATARRRESFERVATMWD